MPLAAYVRVCSTSDIEVALSTARDPREATYLRERWDLQLRGAANLLLAWHSGTLLGRCTVLRESRFPQVRTGLGSIPEIDGLEATPQGTGTGTRLVEAAQRCALSWRMGRIGVALDNERPRPLFERLGFEDAGIPLDDEDAGIPLDGGGGDDGAPADDRARQRIYLVKTLV